MLIVIRPVGRGGSLEPPLLASKRCCIHRKLYFLSALPFENGPLDLISLLLRITAVQTNLVAAIYVMHERPERKLFAQLR